MIEAPTDLDRSLRAHLTTVAGVLAGCRNRDWRYSSYEALVLDRGTVYQASPRPRGVRKGPAKSCYHSTLRLVMARRDLMYCEGYGLPMLTTGRLGIPTFHAWAVDASGRVYDPTWPDPANSAYLGIRFEWEAVCRVALLCRSGFAILETDYQRDTALLRYGRLFPDEEESHV